MRAGFAHAMIASASLLAACTTAPPAYSAADLAEPTASASNYNIAPGDVLDVTIYGHDDLSGEYTVDAEGNISMPLVNQVRASGMSISDLETKLISVLKPDYLRNPDVSVKLVSYRPIFVLGEVENAGSYPYQPNMSVLSAIALAGGYTYRASRKKLFVVRGDDESRQETRITESDTLRPGDTVIIRQRLF